MRIVISMCVESLLWLVAIAVSIATLAQFGDEQSIFLNAACVACMSIASVKLAMCVEMLMRHYQRVVKSHRF